MSDTDRIAAWLIKQARLRAESSSPYLSELLKRYEGNDLLDVLGGDIRPGRWGECAAIPCTVPLGLAPPAKGEAEHAFLSELRLIFGIGPIHDHALRQQGYASIPALLDHPRWKDAAFSLLEQWQRPLNPRQVCESLSYWLSASHPLFLFLLGLIAMEEIAFFDVETLGLGGAPLILAALARPSEGGLTITQYLARSFAEEISLLEQLDHELRKASLLVTYNGKAFDWTTLRERFAYYGLPFHHTPMHIDLLHHVRRAFRHTLPDLQLSTIETHILGIRREEDLPSEAVPEFYSVYVESGNVGPLVPIVHHNRQDVASLVHLLNHFLTRAHHAQ